MIDKILAVLETLSSRISCWAWNKRWADKNKGTGYRK
jgi:hypothetical protein